jgi:hypothetical protein
MRLRNKDIMLNIGVRGDLVLPTTAGLDAAHSAYIVIRSVSAGMTYIVKSGSAIGPSLTLRLEKTTATSHQGFINASVMISDQRQLRLRNVRSSLGRK